MVFFTALEKKHRQAHHSPFQTIRAETSPVCGRNTRNEAEQRETTQEWVPYLSEMSRCPGRCFRQFPGHFPEIRSPQFVFCLFYQLDLSTWFEMGCILVVLSWCFEIMKSVWFVPGALGDHWSWFFLTGLFFQCLQTLSHKWLLNDSTERFLFHAKEKSLSKRELLNLKNRSPYPYHSELWHLTRWWFQVFFIFAPTWGNDPIWLIFFRWVETTNKLSTFYL